MKSGWQTKTLADSCDVFADGDWVESKDQSPEGIRLIQTGNVGQGVFKDRGEKARYISEATFKRLRCTEIFEGDCLISRLPDPVGRSCLLPETGERMITAVDCTILRFKPKQLIPEFFNFFSQSLDYLKAVEEETTGTTRKRISRSKLGQVVIPVPPLPEQQRIIGTLDEAFDGIATAKANAEKNLQNARALFESQLQSVFTQRGEGWREKTLGDVAEVIAGQSPEGKFYNTDGKGLPFYQGKKEFGERFIGAPTIWTSQITKVALEGDVLMSVRAPVGPVNFATQKSCIGRGLSAIRSGKDSDKNFLFYFLLSKQKEIIGSEGAVFASINKKDIQSIEIAVPPLPEQQRIVEQLDWLRAETQRLASIYQQKLTALEALKKSLLDQAFTGNL